MTGAIIDVLRGKANNVHYTINLDSPLDSSSGWLLKKKFTEGLDNVLNEMNFITVFNQD